MTSPSMAANDNAMLTQYSFLFFMSIVSTFVVRLLLKSFTNHCSSLRQPPSPPALPIIGHLHLVGSRFAESFRALSTRFGPLMQIRLGSFTFLVASNAAIAKEILKTQDINFASRFELGPTDYNIYKGTGFITGPDGPYWRFMRKLCVTKLFAGAQLKRFNHIREMEIQNLLKSLMKSSKNGEHCNLIVELETLANNLICKMIMSRKFANNDNEAREMRNLVKEVMIIGAKSGVYEVFGILKKIDLFGHGRKLQEVLWRYDEVMERIMKDYEDNLENNNERENEDKDVVDILLQTHRDKNAEVELTRKHIKHFIIEMFMASLDTLAPVMQWTMAELMNHPNVFKKLREEIESVVGSSRLIRETDVPNLPYLEAIIKETLRLHSPAGIMHRECTKDCKVNGFDVKAKTKTLINAYAIMRDPDTWHDPDMFLPERFLTNSVTADGDNRRLLALDDQDFAYLPFGGGRRGCIGTTHASLVMPATVGALVQCFDWKSKDGGEIEFDVGTWYAGAMAPPLECYPVTHFDPFQLIN